MAHTDRPRPDGVMYAGKLKYLVYTSVAAPGLNDDDLDAILAVARRHNASADITGLLLLRGGMFVQFLEGTAEDIDQLLASIRRDERHTDVKVIIEEPVDRRRFPDWRMGFRRPRETAAPRRGGVRDSFHDLTSGSAREVVERAATEFSLWFRVTEGVTG
ncbi:hypothetical protein B841_05390 [Corynebacterium maris DSM 45190]|uniref:BLUF domain-containing protein n=1 Tax=Corynebacterium maris DSM 45190 TaxID=1224163 RepID=S5TI47_9CORY|nr:BLUF domain-containing protein [Corynebacterium maris]AGS34551.1 hypothetical protein B841_05390 [Corynebacterium maris DSM 45190]